MRALFIEHDHVSIGGPIWRAFEKHGYQIERFQVVPESDYYQPNVPANFPILNQYDVVIAMGAPWGVHEDERIGNWLLPELEKLQAAHNAGVPILGICFGGQLMARALGGSVAPAKEAEIGWCEIESADKSLISSGPWFEYHFDSWQNPKGATAIATTAKANQAFVMGRTLAVQFHPEIDPDVLDSWLTVKRDEEYLKSIGVDIQTLRAQTKREQLASDKRAFDLVDSFLRRVATAEVIKVDNQISATFKLQPVK
jgi:GMP synthase-like glutamine amidotransferase